MPEDPWGCNPLTKWVIPYKKYTPENSYDMDDDGLEDEWEGHMDQYDNLVYNNSRYQYLIFC